MATYSIKIYRKSFGAAVSLTVITALSFFILANNIDSNKSIATQDAIHTYPVLHRGAAPTYLIQTDGQSYDFYMNGFMSTIIVGLVISGSIALVDYRKSKI